MQKRLKEGGEILRRATDFDGRLHVENDTRR